MASSLCWTSVSSTKCRTVLHGGQAYSLCDIANKHSWCGMSDEYYMTEKQSLCDMADKSITWWTSIAWLTRVTSIAGVTWLTVVTSIAGVAYG